MTAELGSADRRSTAAQLADVLTMLAGVEKRLAQRIDKLESALGSRLDELELRVEEIEKHEAREDARSSAYLGIARGVRSTLLAVVAVGGFVLGAIASGAGGP